MVETITLYRPVGKKELALIEANDFKEFPPRLPEQPIFTRSLVKDMQFKSPAVRTPDE